MTDFTDDLRKPLCKEVRCIAERFSAAEEIEKLRKERDNLVGGLEGLWEDHERLHGALEKIIDQVEDRYAFAVQVAREALKEQT